MPGIGCLVLCYITATLKKEDGRHTFLSHVKFNLQSEWWLASPPSLANGFQKLLHDGVCDQEPPRALLT